MKTEYQKCLNGEPYKGSDPEIARMNDRCKLLLKQLREVELTDADAKLRIQKQMFGSMGEEVYIDFDFRCIFGKHIHFGNKVVVNINCTFLDDGIINIGNCVMIAPDVKIYTATHSLDLEERMPSYDVPGAESVCDTIALTVTVEDGVWIGGNSTILPGVTIGHHSVIGAGSVVNKDIPPYSVAVGNPCRVIRKNRK